MQEGMRRKGGRGKTQVDGGVQEEERKNGDCEKEQEERGAARGRVKRKEGKESRCENTD